MIILLGSPDLNDVLEALRAVGRLRIVDSKWMDIGLALGLYMSTLHCIEADHREASRCLIETLDKWLRRADNVMNKGRPSWESLADALRRIDENTSAQYIRGQSMLI